MNSRRTEVLRLKTYLFYLGKRFFLLCFRTNSLIEHNQKDLFSSEIPLVEVQAKRRALFHLFSFILLDFGRGTDTLQSCLRTCGIQMSTGRSTNPDTTYHLSTDFNGKPAAKHKDILVHIP
jgi:hypothetical protein